MNDILKETVNSGTARKLNGYNFDLCAKTGTNGNDKGNIDAYTVAYTTEHTIATWLGRYDNSIFSNKISGGNYIMNTSGSEIKILIILLCLVTL